MALAILLASLFLAPMPIGELTVPYPAGAHGPAQVRLEIEIDAAGQVVGARAIEGAPVFSTAATRAAPSWRFVPARKDGVPVASRIVVSILFREPPTAPAEPPAPAQPMYEVRVRAARPEPEETVVSVEEARSIAGALGDPVRALSALPGVAPTRADSPYLYVRGAPPADTGYLVDGIPVPLLFHGGVATSVIQAPLLEQIDFFPGPAPARFGGFTGGIVNLRTKPPAPVLHGEGAVKLYEASALVETPIGESASALVAGRIGYPVLVTQLVSQQSRVAGGGQGNQSGDVLDYGDYQARGTYRGFTLFAFGSHDRLTDNGKETIASDFHRLDLRYDAPLESGGLQLGVTAGWSSQGALGLRILDRNLAARVLGQLRAGSVRFRGGLEIALDGYKLGAHGEDPAVLAGSPARGEPPPHDESAALHVDAALPVLPGLEITPGLRLAVLASHRALAGASGTLPVVEPRLSVRAAITPKVTSLSAVGLAHQLPLLRAGDAPAIAVSIPGFPVGDVRLQQTLQASQGFRFDLPLALQFESTLYGSWTQGLSDLSATCYEMSTGTRDAPGPPRWICADLRTEGLAYGLELSLRRAISQRLSGWLSYTLSRSTERFPGGPTVLSPFDRTHVLSLAGSYDLGSGWRVGARLSAYSGPPAYVNYENGRPVSAPGLARFPPFARADVRVEKTWALGPHQGLTLVAEVQNVTGSRESDRLDCGPPLAPLGSCVVGQRQAFILPSLGLEGWF